MGELALFGGMGCFDDWANAVHRELIECGAGDGTVRIVATRLDDKEVVAGEIDFYATLGFPASVVYVCSRSDAESPANSSALEGASLVFLHGGMPAWLADMLRDTAVWRALVGTLSRGGSVAATSGAITCLGSRVPAFDDEFNFSGWGPGLAYFSSIVIGSHWDSERFLLLRQPFEELSADVSVLAVDESTVAVRRESSRWSVIGKGAVRLIRDGQERSWVSGGDFDLDPAV